MAVRDTRNHSKQSVLALRFLKVVGAITLFIVTDVALTLCLEPFGDHAESTWTRYRMRASDNIDSAIIGTSVSLESLDPWTLDEQLGSSTFNLSFYGLPLSYTYDSLETLIREHHISRAYVCISFDQLTQADYVNSAVTYTQAKIMTEPFADQIRDTFNFFTDPSFASTPSSLALLFPWAIDSVDLNHTAIINNVKERLTYNMQEKAIQYYPGINGVSKGMSNPFSGVFSPEDNYANWPVSPESDFPIIQSHLDSVANLCKLASSNGVRLYVLVGPMYPIDILRLGNNYSHNMTVLRETVTSSGGVFLDINALKSDYFHFNENDFYDSQHLNRDGAIRFSTVVSDLVQRVESSEDLSGYFYSYDRWAEWTSTIDYLATIGVQTSLSDGYISYAAYPYTGDDSLVVEYQFLQVLPDNTQVELRPYSNDPTYDYDTNHNHGCLHLLIRGRIPGSGDSSIHYCTNTFLY